jgi:hypothetical protein
VGIPAHEHDVYERADMSNLAVADSRIPAMSDQSINLVRQFEEFVLTLPQQAVETHHVIHGGMYARTMMMPANTVLTGALCNVPSILIINGSVRVTIGDEAVYLHGHHVLAASKHRKQAFHAIEDTWLTMLFATDAQTVEEAEDEFTDEANRLLSRSPSAKNSIIITGE